MGLYRAVVGAKITAAEWNTIIGLLKGDVGAEDTIRLAAGLNDVLRFQPNSDPGSVVNLLTVKNAAGTTKWALRSNGLLWFVDQAGTPGSLSDGMLWRDGSKFYGRLNGATVEITTGVAVEKSFFVPAVEFGIAGGTPDLLGSVGYNLKWRMDPSANEGVAAVCKIPYSGTVALKLVQVNVTSNTGNIRWELGYVLSSTTFDGGYTTADVTAAVPSGANAFNDVTMVASLGVTAGQYLSLVAYRMGAHAQDTMIGDMGFLGVHVEYA